MLLSRDGEGGVEATFIQTLKTVVRIEKNNKRQDMFVTVYVIDKIHTCTYSSIHTKRLKQALSRLFKPFF